MQNNLYSDANGTQYGVENVILGDGSGVHAGTRNILSGAGTGVQYGTYNAITSTGSGIHAAGYFDASGGGNSYAAIFQRGLVVVNESGGNSDFRVESENNPYQIFVDASLDRVGINTATPMATLDITPDSGEDALTIQSGIGDIFKVLSNGAVVFGEATGEVSFGDVYFDNYVGMGILTPSYRLTLPNHTSSSGRALANSWLTYSDQRVKTSVEEIQYGLQAILQLRPVQYLHHSCAFENGELTLGEATHDIGFIAQEMHAVIQEIVDQPEDEASSLWSMNYEKLTPVLVKAVQELAAENTTLKEQLNQFEQRLAQVERDYAANR
jgi:hypothetical protein